ncbi:Sperm flagellar protein 1 [Habropoda laboriosa]|uniref:Sperm flagellar protein 1 n=1 Tax=Habropoda laboriosa TaxID=597456 RepID=A0A0L7RHN9_9HYME|nr:Sperm flagellar protein 1 [Habropoda laboriosa]
MADKNVENSENQLEELYTWISGIPLSKPTKNLTRDFSDAVIMAEILKLYCPRYVDLHNYVPVNSLTAKKENWNILNRKVLSKINMKLTKDVIHQLANCQPGTAEHVLLELKKKISKDSEHQKSQDLTYNDKENDSIEEGKIDEHSMNNTLSKSLMPPPVNRSTLKAQGTSENINVEDAVLDPVYMKWIQEIREMEDIICSLTHKITYLKSVMKLKDL